MAAQPTRICGLRLSIVGRTIGVESGKYERNYGNGSTERNGEVEQVS